MESKNLKSAAELDAAGTMAFVLSDKDGNREKVVVSLAALLADSAAAQKAIFFAVKTRLRNSTGGKAFAEALNIVKELADDIGAGKWVARTREAGETRHSPLIRAMARVLFGGDAPDGLEKAQSQYEADIAALAAAAKVNPDPDDDDADGKKALSKIKRDYRKKLENHPALKAAILGLEAEASMAAAQRKAEEAAKAAAAAAIS